MRNDSHYDWETRFLDLFHRCLDRYRSGDEDFTTYYNKDDQAFLMSIGYKPREFFDFVEDFGDGGDPNPIQAVMIAAVRRDYLYTIQEGKLSAYEFPNADLPPKSEEYGGIRWLPRIIQKAQSKLRGELEPDTMYCCGGDRGFLRNYNIHPADFLRVVWAADGDRDSILDYVKSR